MRLQERKLLGNCIDKGIGRTYSVHHMTIIRLRDVLRHVRPSLRLHYRRDAG